MVKRILLAILAVLLVADGAIAAPQVISSPSSASATFNSITFRISDTTDSPAFGISGTCSIVVSIAGSDVVNLYSVPTQSTAAASGSLIGTFASSTTVPTTFKAGAMYAKAVGSTATTGGSVMRVHCSNTQVSSGGSGSSNTFAGWPDFSQVGGTGRPTQAIVVDSLVASSKSTGSGRDDDGSTYAGACLGNATHDQPCTRLTDEISGLQISIDGAASALSGTIDIDVTDPQASFFSRDSVSFLNEIGTANDTCIGADGDYTQTILSDATGATDGGDLYRFVSVYTGALNCTAPSGSLSTGGVLTYATSTSDNLMPFLMDAVHMSPYGSRWTAQEVLTAAWEDQYPEMLGTTNMITNGYFETTCTDTSPLDASSTGTFAAQAGATITPGATASVGQGCLIDPVSNGETFTTATIAGAPGRYYTGSIQLGQSAVATTTRSLVLKIQDNAGTSIANTRFWLGGQVTGVQAEAIETADGAADNTPGELALSEFETYASMTTVHFNFQLPAAATGFKIQIVDAAQNYAFDVDELWVRPKMHSDLERHYVVADGKARIQLFTDSRGLNTRYESLQDSFDYLLGFTTPSGQTRSAGSIRPNLYVDEPLRSHTVSVSGQRLGNYVGENDGFLDYNNVATTAPHLQTLIEDGANYCLAYYGINDLTAGARPSSAAIQSESASVRYKYFIDQLKGFSIAAERMGCIPIAIMEPVTRGDTDNTTHTATKYCTNKSGVATNCASWHQEFTKNLLQTGLP